MKSSEHGIVTWFVRHPNAGKILLLLIIIVGLGGVTSLKQEVFPPFAPSRVDIFIPAQGATASEVEDLVVKKVEESLEGLAGVERIVASASPQGANVSVELAAGVNQQALLSLIKSRIDSVGQLPVFAEAPIFRLPESSEAVMSINLYGDIPTLPLYHQALRLRTEISRLEGVTFAVIENEPEVNVYIDVRPESLQQFNLSITDISRSIEQYSVSASGGLVQTLSNRIQLRADSLGKTAGDFGRIPIVSGAANQALILSDIADVTISPDDQYIMGRFNNEKSFTLSIYRDPAISFSAAKEVIDEYVKTEHSALQPQLSLIIWQDGTREFTSRTSLLLKNGILGFIIICLFMGVFVDPKVAFWTALGMPVSIIGAMGLMHFLQLDISLNAVTLLGFLIALGLIVDDALVIGESVHNSILRTGHNQQAVLDGVHKVAVPATFGALTTIAAFFPLVLTEGELGSKIGGIGVVVICCLIVSLIESKLVLPFHLKSPSTFFNRSIFKSLNKLNCRATHWLRSIAENRYLPVLKVATKRPIATISMTLMIFLLTISMLPLGVLKFSPIPQIADFSLQATIQYAPSISSSQRKVIAKNAVDAFSVVNNNIREEFALDYDPILHISQQYTDSELVIDIELKGVFHASYDAYDIQQGWRDALPYMSGVSSVSVDAGAGSSESIAVQLSGSNLIDLKKASEQLKEYLHDQEDVVDIRDSELAAATELKITITSFAKEIGLGESEVIAHVRRAFYGEEAQRVSVGEREMKVMVRFGEEQRGTLETLENMLIAVPDQQGVNQYVPLVQLATFTKTSVPSEIVRIDKRKTITVYADAKVGGRSSEDIVGEIEDEILPEMLAGYDDVTFSLEGEAKEANKSVSSLLSSSALIVCIIFSLMAIPLGSFRYPALILCIVPFGIVGAFWGHIFYALPFSLLSIFGVIALAGVLINNGLLIVDQYREYLVGGKNVREAIHQSCLQRFRPIVLTSVTTFLGLLPLLWEGDPEALWLVPIAISLGFGLLVATFITLFLFPAMLMLADRRILEKQPSVVNDESSSPPAATI